MTCHIAVTLITRYTQTHYVPGECANKLRDVINEVILNRKVRMSYLQWISTQLPCQKHMDVFLICFTAFKILQSSPSLVFISFSYTKEIIIKRELKSGDPNGQAIGLPLSIRQSGYVLVIKTVTC